MEKTSLETTAKVHMKDDVYPAEAVAVEPSKMLGFERLLPGNVDKTWFIDQIYGGRSKVQNQGWLMPRFLACITGYLGAFPERVNPGKDTQMKQRRKGETEIF